MAWEQVSHNDVALTDVGRLLISVPKSAPFGAQADAAHTCYAASADPGSSLGFCWTPAEDEI